MSDRLVMLLCVLSGTSFVWSLGLTVSEDRQWEAIMKLESRPCVIELQKDEPCPDNGCKCVVKRKGKK